MYCYLCTPSEYTIKNFVFKGNLKRNFFKKNKNYNRISCELKIDFTTRYSLPFVFEDSDDFYIKAIHFLIMLYILYRILCFYYVLCMQIYVNNFSRSADNFKFRIAMRKVKGTCLIWLVAFELGDLNVFLKDHIRYPHIAMKKGTGVITIQVTHLIF